MDPSQHGAVGPPDRAARREALLADLARSTPRRAELRRARDAELQAMANRLARVESSSDVPGTVPA